MGIMKKFFVTFFLLVPVVLSFLLLGAHFMRAGNTVLVILSLLMIVGIFVRHKFSALAMQVVLIVAAVEWVRTIIVKVSERMDQGVSWGRLAIILGVVACFTFLSSLVFFSETLTERYRLKKRRS